MKGNNQTHQGVATSMKGLLGPKHTIRIGTWNVRTMYDTSKCRQVTNEMDNYNLGILGVSECRWTERGKLTLQTGHTILYSGNEKHHVNGVAIIMNKKCAQSLIEWKPISERIIMARFESNYCKLTFIQVYAPTNDKEEEIKKDFYGELQREINNIPKHDMLLIAGDFNAKIGSDRTGFEKVMGTEGIGDRNENGDILLDFCINNEMIVGGSQFMHKNIHKTTWNSPDGRTRNLIDHVLINRKWAKSMQDVKVHRGADVGSDHQLVISKIKLKLRTLAKKSDHSSNQFDTFKLKNETYRRKFVLELRNRFQILEDQTEENVENTWNNIKDNFCSTASRTLGYRKKENKEWLSDETWKKIDERKKIKSKLLNPMSETNLETLKEEYNKKDKEVKKSARNDKRTYIENLAEEAQKAAERGDLRSVYQITKKLSNKRGQKSSSTVKAKDGKILTTENEVANRWKEHFKEVLNRPEPEFPARPENYAHNPEIEMDIGPPTHNEVKEAIQGLKNNKAPGPDQITAEMLKSDIELSTKILTNLFEKIWRNENLPTDWAKGIIVKIPKKGDLNDCNNWRGITLLSIPGKVLCKVILKRIDEKIDKSLREEQAGFRRGRGCIDQIFTLRNIIEQCAEWNSPIHINFVDFQKAFDSIHRLSLWKILKSYGIPDKLISIISKFYENFQSCVAVGQNQKTEYFDIATGVRQGCILSPILFIIIIDWVLKRTIEDKRRGLQLGISDCLEDLDFADDLALLSSTMQHLQEKTDRLVKFAEQVGLFVNIKKTEVMSITKNITSSIEIKGEKLKTVNKFTYLGSVISKDDGARADIQTRISKARVAFNSLNNIWKSSKYSEKTKIKLYNSNVKSVLLYGSECWRVVSTEMAKISSFHNSCLRRICKVFWPNKITNEDLYKRTNCKNIEKEIQQRRLKWLGHVLRMDKNRYPKKCLKWHPPGKRSKGRPKATWRRSIESELKEMGMTWGEAAKHAHDRKTWRQTVAVFTGWRDADK